MTRRIVIWLGLVSIAAGMVLHTSLRAREQEDRLAELNRSIAAEQDRINVLTAEWHSLKTPERLEALVHRHMPALTRVAPTQLASLTEIPDPLPATAPAAVAQAAGPAPAAKPLVLAQAGPAAAPRPAPTVRAVRTPPAPAAHVTPAARTDELASLIERSNTPEEVRTVTEHRPGPGVLWASMEELR